MSSAHASEEQRAANDARRRKRRERAAKNRAPEPKDIVSGAGQPLDVGVRRELEEALGHDLGGVRLHTDRDADALTGMLGADAVAVGQDVFFREGAYAPGTDEGRRLLAHELLHTVQNPYGAGPLAAGRDFGAVSLPHEAAEQEAESAARRLMREETAAEPEAPGPVDVAQDGTTPAWMRYATVDADRMRAERLDPAGLVERLAGSVVRLLRSDPEDRSKRTRRQLGQLPEVLQDEVLERLETRLLSAEHGRLLDLLDEYEQSGEAETGGLEWQGSLDAPAVLPDPVEELEQRRADDLRAAGHQQTEKERPAPAPGPEKDRTDEGGAAGSTPENGGPGQGGAARQGDREQKKPDPGTGGDASSPTATGRQPESPAAQSDAPGARGTQGQQVGGEAAASKQEAGRESGEGSGKKDGERQQAEERKADGPGEKERDKAGKTDKAGAEAGNGTGRDASAESKEESAAGRRPGAADSLAAGGTGKDPKQKDGKPPAEGSPVPGGRGTELPAPSSRLEGVRNQDAEGPEEQAEEDPSGAGGDSEVEAGGEEKSAWDVELQPEDFLPEQDLDVSAVPSAATVDHTAGPPAMPSFPAPPMTRADKVQAERDTEDAEDEAAEEEPGEEQAVGEGEAARPEAAEPSVETEGGPPSLAEGAGAEGAPGRRQTTASKDPKRGDDPKDGPVTSQTTVQETPGGREADGAVKEQAAKEEKGTQAGGEKTSGAPEKETQKAAGSGSGAGAPEHGKTASASDHKSEGKGAGAGTETSDSGTTMDKGGSGTGKGVQAEDKGGPASDSASPSPARDSHVSGQPGSGTSASGTSGGPGGSGGSGGSGATEAGPSADAAERPAESPAKGTSHSESAGERRPGPESSPHPAAPAASAPAKAAPAASAASAKSAPPAKSAPEPEHQAAAAGEPAAEAQPAPRSRGGGGARGGGGKGSGPGKGQKKKAKAAPNLSQMSPEAGLSTASRLKPHQAMEAMGGVSGAVDRTVGDEHQQLAGAPPAMERPSGAPRTLHGKPGTDAPAQYSQDPAKKADAPKDEKAEVKGEKKPEGEIEAEKAEEPGGWDTFKMALGFGVGKVLSWVGFEVDAEELAAKFAGLPTKDEALKQAQAGNAPGVEMQGAAGGKADEQDGHVDAKGQETAGTARDDAARDMGEKQVYPDAPKEQLEAKVPKAQGGKGRGPAGAARTGAVPPEAASEVAEHDRGPQFRKAFTEGRQGMAEGRKTKDKDTRRSKEKHKQSVDKEVASNTENQAGERDKALRDVDGQREDWRKEQDGELKKLGTKKSERHDKVRKDVKEKEEQTDKDVGREKEGSDKKIKDENTKAEENAEKKKDDSVQQSGNWITKAFDWIKEKVIEIKNAIVKVIKDARDAVVGFIKNFKETVERWINEAREAIVDAIKKFVDDLIEFARAMVRAVIELAQRIRKFITSLVEAAIALVTKLARMLKQVVTGLLNALAKLLSDILNILKKMLRDVIEAVVDAVKTVLDYASKLLGALGEFMLVAVDFLSDPGGWLSGAKNSAVDGAKNHLFREVKAAVKAWFQAKIEEIIGVPKAILDKLLKAGWTLERIAKETWDAIVPQLPFIIGEIVITKVVAKLIPGAGWVMAVIDAIRTAIGALGEILRAMGAVLDWLKAVRRGGAGILFAKAVAAGIVALLELAYEALLSGIGKYVGKIGRRLKGIAAKLGKGTSGKPGGSRSPAPAGGGGRGGRGGKRKRREEPPEREGAPMRERVPAGGAPRGGGPAGARPKPDTKPGGRPGATPDTGKPGGKRTDGNGKDGGDDKVGGKPVPRPGKVGDGRRKDGDAGGGKDGDGRGRDGKKPPVRDADGRPSTSKDKDGKPADKDTDKPDTRPTPSPKPKPGPESRPQPRPKDDDKDTKPKPDDKDGKDGKGDKDGKGTGKDSDRPKKDDGKDSTKPQDDDKGTGKDRDHDKEKDKDPSRPKDKEGRDKEGKDKDGGDGDRKKPRADHDAPARPKRKPRPDKGGPGRRRPKPDRKGPGRTRPRPDKSGRGRPKSRSDKDRRRRGENSGESKNDRLRKIVARLRPRLYRAMKPGIPRSSFLSLLQSMKRYYRLTGLKPVGGDPFTVVASLNPSLPVLGGDYSEPRSEPSAHPDPPGAPPTKLPKPEIPGGSADRASTFTAEYLSAGRVPPDPKRDARHAPKDEPKGYDYIEDPANELPQKGAWLKLHLLPAKIGGPARGNNLVPARRNVNKDLELGVENPAKDDFFADKPIRYESQAQFGNTGRIKDIPTFVRSTFRRYEHIRGTGEERTDWRLTGDGKSVKVKNIAPPQSKEKEKLYINTYGDTLIKKWMNSGQARGGAQKVNERIVRAIRKEREASGAYTSLRQLEQRLDTYLGGKSPDKRKDAVDRLRNLQQAKLLEWIELHQTEEE